MSCDCGVSSVERIAISSARSVSTLASCAFKFRLRILSASFHDNNSVVFSLLSAFQPLLAIYYMSKARTCIRFNSAYQMRFSALTPLPFYVCLFSSHFNVKCYFLEQDLFDTPQFEVAEKFSEYQSWNFAEGLSPDVFSCV